MKNEKKLFFFLGNKNKQIHIGRRQTLAGYQAEPIAGDTLSAIIMGFLVQDHVTNRENEIDTNAQR